MCGQGGIAGSIDVKDEQVFKKLLILNSMRGLDSTGAASVKRIPDYKTGTVETVVAKELGHAYNLLSIRHKDYFDFSDVLNGTHRMLIGHCRASTRGATTTANAHPFTFDDIVGTHNGTLGNSSHRELKGYFKFQTDSEAVFNEIQMFGVGELTKKLKGYKDPKSVTTCEDAYALVWYDNRDNSVNMLRNKERPLWFTFDKEHKKLYWSSEGLHLVTATAEVEKNDDDKFWELPADVHYKWVIPEFGKPFGKPLVTKRPGTREDRPFWNNKKDKDRGDSGFNTQGFQFKKTLNSGPSGSDSTKVSTLPADEPGDNPMVFYDKNVGFWSRWNNNKKKFKFSALEKGPFWYAVQHAWDDLTPEQQRTRIISKNVPLDIQFPRWKYDDQKNEYIYLPPGGAAKLEEPQKPAPARQKMADQVQGKHLVEALNEVDKKLFVHVFKDERREMFWDMQTKQYFLFTYMGPSSLPHWDRQMFKRVPFSIPFTRVDVNARHSYKHRGKGKRKVIYYKGYNNEMIVQQTFEKIMGNGCLGCKRCPAWGTEVRFVDKELFICEFCSRDTQLVKEWEEAARLKTTDAHSATVN